jgi:hypothetical protein|tara:strand:- start:282 stop:446 length:165 start_codon:yes stop_codon:yes gene_type:complete
MSTDERDLPVAHLLQRELEHSVVVGGDPEALAPEQDHPHQPEHYDRCDRSRKHR